MTTKTKPEDGLLSIIQEELEAAQAKHDRRERELAETSRSVNRIRDEAMAAQAEAEQVLRQNDIVLKQIQHERAELQRERERLETQRSTAQRQLGELHAAQAEVRTMLSRAGV